MPEFGSERGKIKKLIKPQLINSPNTDDLNPNSKMARVSNPGGAIFFEKVYKVLHFKIN
jgi:hypothetical protein